jgi:WD40 repeat protein
MSDHRSLLEREMERVELRPFTLDSFYRRRARKRRNERLAAGAVGVALFAALLIAVAVFRAKMTIPADETPSPSPSIEESALPQILGPDEVPPLTLWRDEDLGQGAATGIEAVYPGGPYRTLFGYRGTCQNSPCPSIIDHGQTFLSGDGKWAAAATETCDTTGLVCSTNEIWVANGLAQATRVTQACETIRSCHRETWAWSPVGATLAIWEDTDPQRLYLFDPATGERTVLAEPEGNGVEGLTWSPDGSQVTYAVEGANPAAAKIYTIPVSGGSPTFLADGLDPVWSPDGTKLSFVVSDQGIFVADADGSGAASIGTHGVEAVWSPDGSRIVYRVEHGPSGGPFHQELWVVSPDGSDGVNVLDGTWPRIERWSLTWSPDGTRIAFDGDHDHPNWPPPYGDEWYVVNADGSGGLDRIDTREVAAWRS